MEVLIDLAPVLFILIGAMAASYLVTHLVWLLVQTARTRRLVSEALMDRLDRLNEDVWDHRRRIGELEASHHELTLELITLRAGRIHSVNGHN